MSNEAVCLTAIKIGFDKVAMETSQKTAREIYQDLKANPSRARFGFGKKPILVNVDLQKAYTRPDLFGL